MPYALNRYEAQVSTGSGLDAVAAAWLIYSPLVLGFGTAASALTNNIACGCAILMLAIPRFMGAYRQIWMSWIICAIGLWVVISPWVLGFANNHTATASNVITGIVIAFMAWWSAVAANPTEDTTADRTDVGRP